MNRPVRTRTDPNEVRARILEVAEEHFRRTGHQELQDFLLYDLIKGRGHFVADDELRIGGNRSRNADPLLLAPESSPGSRSRDLADSADLPPFDFAAVFDVDLTPSRKFHQLPP